MPEIKLSNEFSLLNFDAIQDLKLLQDKPADASQVILGLLDERYISTVLSMTFSTLIKSWQGEEEEHYSQILNNFPSVVLERMAYCHGVLNTGEENPLPEDMPDATPDGLIEDFSEMDQEVQTNVLANALRMQLGLEVSSGMHPYSVVAKSIGKMPVEYQEELTSNFLTQYVRQYHSSRQNLN